MLSNLGLSKNETDKIQLFTVWPYLSRKEPCKNSKCPMSGWHPRFQEKDKVCWDPGMTDPPNFDPRVRHLFKEDIEIESVKILLKNLAEENEIEEKAWMKILARQTRYACGALFDEISKLFFLLGPNQLDLRDSEEHKIMEPRIIEGKAGTGKTLTIAAKIERLFHEGKITALRKAVYICYSDQSVEQIKFLLRHISLENIEVFNARKHPRLKHLIENPRVVLRLIKDDRFNFIFVDECEDLSEKNSLAHIFQWSTDDCNISGHCWLLFDQHQSHDPAHRHFLIASRVTGKINWTGHTMDRSLFGDRIETLQAIFRMTHENARYIKNNNLIPDMEVNMAHKIEGLKTSTRNIPINSWDNAKPILITEIVKSALKLNCDRNIHPGKIAFLMPDSDYKDIIGETIEQFLDGINKEMKNRFVKPKKEDIIPKFTNKIIHNFLKIHDHDIKHCTCAFYFGCVSDVKGLDIQVVHLLQITVADDFYKMEINSDQSSACVGCSKTGCSFKLRRAGFDAPMGRSSDTGDICTLRTWPLYTAVTRSTCEFQVTNLVVEEAVLLQANTNEIISEVMKTSSEENCFEVYDKNYNHVLEIGGMSTPKFGCNIEQIFWNKDDDLVITRTKGGRVQIFSTGAMPTVLEQENVKCMDMSSTGIIATIRWKPQKLTTWTSDGELLESVNTKCRYTNVQFSQQGTFVLCTRIPSTSKYCSSVYRVKDLHQVHKVENFSTRLLTISWCGDSRLTYYIENDKVLKHVDITTQEPQAQDIPLKTMQNTTALKWDKDARYLAIGFDDASLKVWTQSNQTLHTLTTTGYTTCLEWSTIGDHAMLAIFIPDKGVRVWDIETWQCLYTISIKTNVTWPVLQFSNSGSLLAIAEDEAVLICDMKTGELFLHENMNSGRVVRWGPGDNKLAVISEDHRIMILDMHQ